MGSEPIAREYGSIERDIHVDASPPVVFEVITRPEHIREWWPCEAGVEPVAGAVGEVVLGDRASGQAHAVSITVVEVDPPRRFSFRWIHPSGDIATAGNSLLVTFELVPSGTGTVVRVTETGFREMGWEVAVLDETYENHCGGWDRHLARLGPYLTQLVSNR
jgi:uncharacterized protein YndB with AHSA1/START domain